MSAAPASAPKGGVSKGEFAAILGVSPGRVSQYIAAGQIFGDAIIGEGRYARIDVELAKAQLREVLDIGQRFGNGLDTRLDANAEPAADDQVDDDDGDDDEDLRPRRTITRTIAVDPVERQIKAAKLQGLQYALREKAEAELARRGTYVRADEVAAAMSKISGSMLNVFEGGLADIASAISARFEIPQRDVLHLLRTEFVNLRRKGAATARKAAEAMPALKADEVEVEEES